MVAPLNMHRPTRVFARLTFTGENKTSVPVCCDLSRVASIVPANPLPSNLAGAIGGEGKAKMECISRDEKLSVLCHDNQTVMIPPYSDDAKLDEHTAPADAMQSSPGLRDANGRRGRKRTHELHEDSEVNSKPVKVVRSGAEAGNSAVAGEQCGRQEMHHIDALLSENKVLKQQNKILAQKILAFQRILRSETNFEHARQKVTALESATNNSGRM